MYTYPQRISTRFLRYFRTHNCRSPNTDFYLFLPTPWFRQLIAGLSPQRPGFVPRVSPYGICGGQSGIGAGISQNSLIFLVNIILPWLSMLIYHWGMNNRPAGSRSSETYSHPINMNNNKFLFFILSNGAMVDPFK
jgi:hypothetical protein